MHRFTCYRVSPPKGYRGTGYANPPAEPQFEGVVYSDGTCAVRWLTAYRSHSTWASLQDLMAVHGHPEYESRIDWPDGEPVECANCAEAGEPGAVWPVPA
jgi:hypothetical protein